MLSSKVMMFAGCVAAVVGGTTVGWLAAGMQWQKALPMTTITPYFAPAAVAEKAAPSADPAPAVKAEEPAPADTPQASPPEEKKAQPKGRVEPTRAAATEGKKRKAPAAAPDPEVITEAVVGKRRLKAPDADSDVGRVPRIAKRYLDIPVDADE